MWIRSQNKKELIPIGEGGFFPCIEGQIIKYYNCSNFDNNGILGEYKTEEKALKILDEIQFSIYKCENDKINSIKETNLTFLNSTYEMP